MRDIVHDKAEWIFKQEQSKPQIPFALSYILISDPFPLRASRYSFSKGVGPSTA